MKLLFPGKLRLCLILLVFQWFTSWAQEPSYLIGTIVDQYDSPVPGVAIQVSGQKSTVYSQTDGSFQVGPLITGQTMELTLEREGYVSSRLQVEGLVGIQNLGRIRLARQENTAPTQPEDIPVITLAEGIETNNEANDADFTGFLRQTRDPFQFMANSGFGVGRFRLRGWSNEDELFYMNGALIQNPEFGSPNWNSWSGLNDVTRRENFEYGLAPSQFSFGRPAGSTLLDARPGSQRKGLSASYSLTNRNYRQRIMLTYGSGWLSSGWSFTLSGSRRWAQEGYEEGTFFDAWSYFAAAEKKWDQHRLGLTVMGASIYRGTESPAIREMFELTGDRYYNSYWGYQNGEKRNARVSHDHLPTAILRHDWNAGSRTLLTTTLHFQTGIDGLSSLNWFNAPDPRPDYYSKLPSYAQSQEIKDILTQAFRTDPAVSQINWENLYNINRSNIQTIQNVDGIPGNTFTGVRSEYIVEERRSDPTQFGLTSNIQTSLGERFDLQAGVYANASRNRYYKTVQDLLGGEYILDFDNLAQLDFNNDTTILANDLQHPNRIIREGDEYGYKYDIVQQQAHGWVQGTYHLPKAELFAAVFLGGTSFYRKGYFQNGRFPDNSLGKSEVHRFLNPGGKLGLQYALNGRNYLSGAIMYLSRPPIFRNSFISPQTRDFVLKDLNSEILQSAELNYNYRSPYFTARVSGYFNKIQNRSLVRSYFDDIENTFANLGIRNLDQQMAGTEFSLSYKISPSLSASAIAAIGEYIYVSRPTLQITQNNTAIVVAEDRTSYLKNYYVSGSPQEAYALNLRYEGKHYWTFSATGNLTRRNFVDVNPNRRTYEAVEGIPQGSENWITILDQEDMGEAFTLDLFATKSWRIRDYSIYCSAGINNVLNNTGILASGFEQLRFDFDDRNPNKFPSRYFYAPGINYFLSVSFRY